MSQFILDVFFAFSFVMLLVFLSKMKKESTFANIESYRYAYGGILILCLVSVLELAGHQDLLRNVPFFSVPLYLELAETIGIITGIALLLAGVSIWLPVQELGAGKKQNGGRHGKGRPYNLDRFIFNSGDTGLLFRRLVDVLMKRYGFDAFALYRYDRRDREYAFHHQKGLSEKIAAELGEIRYPPGDFNYRVYKIENLYEFTYTFPIRVNGSNRAVLFFRKGGRDILSDRERSELDHIGHVYERRLTLEYGRIKNRFFENYFASTARIKKIFTEPGSFKISLSEFFRLLRDRMKIEYFSLILTRNGRADYQRYIIGLTGNVLKDGLGKSGIENSHLREVFETGRPVLIENCCESGAVFDPLPIDCGQKTLFSVPVRREGMVAGALTIGRSRKAGLSQRDCLMMEFLTDAAAPFLIGEIYRQSLEDKEKYLTGLSAFRTRVEKCASLEEVVESAAEALMEYVGSTMARIVIFDEYRAGVKLNVVRTQRAMEYDRSGEISPGGLSGTRHRQVLEENRILLINCNDNGMEMSPAEVETFLFGGVQSALIVPISVNDSAKGLISLGEMREGSRFQFDSARVIFAGEVAAVISGALKFDRLSRIMVRPSLPRARNMVGNGDDDGAYFLKGLKESASGRDIPNFGFEIGSAIDHEDPLLQSRNRERPVVGTPVRADGLQ